MRWSIIAATVLFFAAVGFGQGGRGTISGTVTNPDKDAITGALVQAQNTTSGMIYKAESSRTGTYTIPGLPAGTYELSIPAIGFTFDRYVKKDLRVQPGQTLRADVRLEWSANLGTVGDDTFLTILNRYAGLKGPAPHMPNGKPDFSGVWNGSNDLGPEESSALPWAAEIKKQRVANSFKDGPSGFCLPGEISPSSPLLYRFVQTSSLLVQLTEDQPSHRLVFMDGRAHPKDPDPSWKGHSIGKWEGDTLVVDTVGFNDRSWLPDGLPHTEMLHVIERYRRPDLAHLTIDITLEDPGTLTKPWQLHTTWTLAPREEILEYICIENNQFKVSK
jgi:Carboxypeptidase regulatory-like domain